MKEGRNENQREIERRRQSAWDWKVFVSDLKETVEGVGRREKERKRYKAVKVT